MFINLIPKDKVQLIALLQKQSTIHGIDAIEAKSASLTEKIRSLKDPNLTSWFQVRCNRQPQSTVLVHSDQGSQFSSYDWQAFLKVHNLQPSMSRRGNCHDNAVSPKPNDPVNHITIRHVRSTFVSKMRTKDEPITFLNSPSSTIPTTFLSNL